MAETSKTLESPQRTATVEIASQGDIMIEMTSSMGLATLRVASQVLCTTSPVFRAMLGNSSRFKEACELREKADSSEPYKLTLVEDSPEALGVILLALHCQNDRVPQSLSFEQLNNLAIVCDKYDCAVGVLPWVDIWTKRWKPYANTKGYERWLFIAWVFDIRDVFEKLSKKFILEGYCQTSAPKYLVVGPTKYLDWMMLPGHITKEIYNRRNKCVKSMSEATFSCREQYLTSWGKAICKCATPSEGCDAMILGSLMKGFQSLGIAKDFDQFTLKSIKQMSEGIEKLRIEFIPPISKDPYYSRSGHKDKCDPIPRLKAEINAIVGQIKGLDLISYKPKKTKAAAAGWNIFTYI